MARRPVSGRDGIKVIVSTASWGEVPWTRIPAILGKQGQPRQRLSLLLPLPPQHSAPWWGCFLRQSLEGSFWGGGDRWFYLRSTQNSQEVG